MAVGAQLRGGSVAPVIAKAPSSMQRSRGRRPTPVAVLKCERNSCGAKPAEECDNWGSYTNMVNDTGALVRTPSGPACLKCHVVFVISYEQSGKTLDEILTLCNSNPEEDAKFTLAVAPHVRQ